MCHSCNTLNSMFNSEKTKPHICWTEELVYFPAENQHIPLHIARCDCWQNVSQILYLTNKHCHFDKWVPWCTFHITEISHILKVTCTSLFNINSSVRHFMSRQKLCFKAATQINIEINLCLNILCLTVVYFSPAGSSRCQLPTRISCSTICQ
jgi:hypothetical protein